MQARFPLRSTMPTTTTMASKDLITRSDKPASALTTTTRYKSNVPPPPPPQILEEDEYIEALSKIIERDFFPDLAKLKRQHAYLDAVKMNDVERIEAAARDITGNDTPLGQRRLKTPARTPRVLRSGVLDQSWTPARVDIRDATPTWLDDSKADARTGFGTVDTPIIDTPSASVLRNRNAASEATPEEDAVDTTLTLDQFQARYTSEDNASFGEIIERINAQKREKFRWMYEQEKKSQRLLENGHTPSQKQLRQAGEEGDEESGVTSGSGSQDESSHLALMLSDKRSGVISTWEYKAKNALMYNPEGLGTVLDEKTIRGNPKEIVHQNTSFQGRDLLVINQAAAAKIDPTSYMKGKDTDTPKVGGYSFVSSTPTPSMSQMGDDPDMMTWGAIEDEPLLISSGIGASEPSPFNLPPTPRRELIAQKLSEKATKRFRENSSLRAKVFASPSLAALSQYHSALGGTTPTPRFNSPYTAVSSSPFRATPGGSGSQSRNARISSPNPRARAEMLSPAAKSLLVRARNSNSRGADLQLRSSYGNASPSVDDRAGNRQHAPVTPSPLTKR